MKIESAPRHTQSHSTNLLLRKYILFLIKVALEVNGYFVNIMYTPSMFFLASTQTSQKFLHQIWIIFKGGEGHWIKIAVDFQFCTTSKHFDSSNFISPPCNRIVLCTIHTIQYTSLTMKRVGCYGAWSSQWKGHVPCLLCKMQGRRTVWKPGGARSNIMGIICPSWLR